MEDKIYSADDVYSSLLLSHKSLCLELEKWKFVDIPSHADLYKLDDFMKFQEKRADEVRNHMSEISIKLRDNVMSNIRIVMDKLREEIVMDIAAEKNYGRINLQMFPISRKICPLYEKMGFPENMSYGQRTVLRKECSRFIRFSYLADYVCLESLKNVYVSSVKLLIKKIYEQVREINNSELNSEDSEYAQSINKRKLKNPLFKIEIVLDETPINEALKRDLEDEMLAPGLNPDLFHPNIHLVVEDTDNHISFTPVKASYVPDIHKIWLKLVPNKQKFLDSLLSLVYTGLDCMKVVERWSKHPDLNDFASALEEWDDKVAEM